MRIEELNPEKLYAVIIESADVAEEDVNRIAKRFKDQNMNVITLADAGPSWTPMTRYWGIWVSSKNTPSGWLRDGNGRFFYYPSPAIAQAHLDQLISTSAQVSGEIKEFTLTDTLEGL